MRRKSKPYQFTLLFNKELEDHVVVANYLNKLGRCKAQVIVDAMKMYMKHMNVIPQMEVVNTEMDIFKQDKEKTINNEQVNALQEIVEVSEEKHEMIYPELEQEDIDTENDEDAMSILGILDAATWGD